MTARQLNALHLTLILCWIAASVALWPSLPERIPTHFGASGVADAFSDRSFFSWYGLPILGTLLALFMYGISRAQVGGSMDMWNIPEKERFLRLTPEQQAPLMDRLRRVPLACGLLTTVMLLAVHVGVYQVATSERSGLPWYCKAAIVGSIVLILVLAVWETRNFGEAVRRA